jgi:hypothetical protein
MKLQPILEGILREEEDKKQIAAMDQAMQAAAAELANLYKSSEAEIKQDVEQSEEKLNEALGAVAIIGFILALPKVVELLVKGVGKIVAVWKKLVKPGQAKGQEEEFAHNIIEFTHKWHKTYIKGLKWILQMSGVFKKAGIVGDTAQMKAAEAIYYTIIAGLAIYSGVGAVGAFKAAAQGAAHGGGFSLAAFEAAMASVKTSEVSQFIVKLGLKAA